jgi:hypothetical protein
MGLGVGILVGQTYSDVRDGAEQHELELAAMRRELALKLGDASYQEAFKVAAAEVHEEIIGELAQAAKGALPARRLSDPRNVDGRNEEFVTRAASALKRISGGKLELSDARKDKIRAQRPLK